MGNILDCKLLRDFGELEKFSMDWHRLQVEGGKGEVFQHFAWVQAWWESLGKNNRLFTPIVLRNRRVVGILPLVLNGKLLQFIGHSVNDYNHFLSVPNECDAALEACLDTLQSYGAEWNEILLENVPASSQLVRSIQNLGERWQRWIVTKRGDQCPTLLLGENRQNILASLLSKKSLKRSVRRLERIGNISFRHIENSDEITSHLPRFFKQHIRRSAIAGRRSAFLNHDYASFYSNLFKRFGSQSEIRFSVLELDSHPIAYHFGTLFDSKYFWYKPAFDIDFWELSPGQVILWYLFKYLQTVDVREFDFGRGDETFKFRFSNYTKQNLCFSILTPEYRSVLKKTSWLLLESVKKKVRSSITLDSFFQGIIGKWRDLHLPYRSVGKAAVLRKLLGKVIFEKEELWWIFVDFLEAPAEEQVRVTIEEVSLGGLADLANEFPGFLTEELLFEARLQLRKKNTAWTASINGSMWAVIWTSIDKEISTPAGALSIPEKAILVFDIWPMHSIWNVDNLRKTLFQFAIIAKSMNLPMWTICPKRLLFEELLCKNGKMRPAYKLVRKKIFGKTHWRSSQLSSPHGCHYLSEQIFKN